MAKGYSRMAVNELKKLCGNAMDILIDTEKMLGVEIAEGSKLRNVGVSKKVDENFINGSVFKNVGVSNIVVEVDIEIVRRALNDVKECIFDMEYWLVKLAGSEKKHWRSVIQDLSKRHMRLRQLLPPVPVAAPIPAPVPAPPQAPKHINPKIAKKIHEYFEKKRKKAEEDQALWMKSIADRKEAKSHKKDTTEKSSSIAIVKEEKKKKNWFCCWCADLIVRLLVWGLLIWWLAPR